MRTRLRRWRERARAARRLDARAQRLAIEATTALAVARVLIVALPFHRVALRLATGDPAAPGDADDIAEVTRMVTRMARAMPFRAKCLEQAVATAVVLRRRGVRPTLHLGTARGARFEAHAWVSVAGQVILGGPVERYAEVIRF